MTVRSASGTRSQWTFRIRVDDHGTVSGVRDRCRCLQPFASSARTNALTTGQLEALKLALDRGSVDESRRVTLADLPADLGITRQSLAGRLRRGHRTLLVQLFETTDQSADTQPTELW